MRHHLRLTFSERVTVSGQETSKTVVWESRGESYRICGTVLGHKTPKTVGWYLRHRLGPTVSEGSLQKSIIEFVAPYLETKPKDVLMAFAALSETNLLRRES